MSWPPGRSTNGSTAEVHGQDAEAASAAPSPWAGAVAIAAVLSVALTLNLSRLGARSLLGDEAIYASVGRELAVHGHWYPPMAHGDVFVSKPPLAVWVPALSFLMLGIDEGADRLPSALAGVAVAVLVCALGTWLWGPWIGALAGLLLGTCRPWLFLHGARDGVSDPLLTLLLTMALLFYLRHRSTGGRAWLLAAGGAAALSSLLKGGLGPLLLLAITVAWETAVWATAPAAADSQDGAGPAKRRPRQLAAALRRTLALTLMGISPYLVWVADNLIHVPGFLSSLRRETLTRALRGIDPGHIHGPTYYFQVFGDAFGHWWIAILPAAIALVRLRRQGGPRANAALLVPIWAIMVEVCLSLSVSKLPWYLDPAFPAVAVLLAAGVGEVGRSLARWPALRLVFVLAVAALLGARGVAAWRTLAQPVQRNPMNRLALAVRQRGQTARLYLDEMGADLHRIREWNYYYLYQLDDVAQPLPAVLDTRRCNFVVTTHAAALLSRRDLAGAALVAADRRSPEEPELSILDLCGGALAPGAPGPQAGGG